MNKVQNSSTMIQVSPGICVRTRSRIVHQKCRSMALGLSRDICLNKVQDKWYNNPGQFRECFRTGSRIVPPFDCFSNVHEYVSEQGPEQ